MTTLSKHPLYDALTQYTFGAASEYLNTHIGPGHDAPTVKKIAIVLFCLAGAAKHVRVAEESMPNIINRIDKDVFASECITYFLRSLQLTTAYYDRKFRPKNLSEAVLYLNSTGRHVVDFIEQYTSSSWSSLCWGRWLEYVKINDSKILFDQYSYFLHTSKGHKYPAIRYDPSPPVIIDFAGSATDMFAMMEVPIGEISCGENLLLIREALVELAPLLPEDEDELEDDDVPVAEAGEIAIPVLRTVERAAELAKECSNPMKELRLLVDIALKAQFCGKRDDANIKRTLDLERTIFLIDQHNDVDTFIEDFRARLTSDTLDPTPGA